MAFQVGDMVENPALPGRQGVVQRLDKRLGGIQYYTVFWGGVHGHENLPEHSLRPAATASTPLEVLEQGNPGGSREFKRLLTQYRLARQEPLSNHVYAFNASRTKFYPYQFKPLLKFLSSPQHRILIADEVGLGKTIEAGLILTELEARQPINTAIIVCPANLRVKWRTELRNRFDQEFEILTTGSMVDWLEEYNERPERTKKRAIISYESIRSKRVIEILEATQPSFDFVAIDEAHHMRNTDTRTYRVGRELSSATLGSGALVLLTATPVHLGNQNLFTLLNLLDAERFPSAYVADDIFRANTPVVKAQSIARQRTIDVPALRECLSDPYAKRWIGQNPLIEQIEEHLNALEIEAPEKSQGATRVDLQRDLAELNLLGHIFTRTRKREVHTGVAERRPYNYKVPFSPRESEFYEAVTAFVREEASRHGHDHFVQLLLTTPERRMASCIPAMVEHYKNVDLFAEADSGEDQDWTDFENTSGFRVSQDEDSRARLKAIVESWDVSSPDTKFEKFLEIITKQREERHDFKLVVFSFFKGTLRYLERRLHDEGISTALLSGDVPMSDRAAHIERFRSDSRCEVLLSSRVGSEGLDFQFCDTMVNYDLPWNPMEVEQRIGRLDRIGQKSSRINIYNLWIEDTIETRILQRLYTRIRIFEESVGELESILGQSITRLEREALSRNLSPEELEAKADEEAEALLGQRRQLEVLESKRAEFIGTDAFFDEELEKINSHRRYVTARQLRDYLVDFFDSFTPKSGLVRSDKGLVERLSVRDDLRALIRETRATADLNEFFQEEVAVTFDRETAFDHPKVEFLNTVHPLVRFASTHLTSFPEKLVRGHVLKLQTDLLEPGNYTFFVYQVKVTSARPMVTLETFILDEGGKSAATADAAEQLLGQLIESSEDGERVSRIPDIPRLRSANEAARKFLGKRIESIEAEKTRHNDTFVERQVASVKAFYERKIEGLRERLERGKAKGSEERYLRMMERQAINLENEMEARLSELNDRRAVSVSYDDVAIGELVVGAPNV